MEHEGARGARPGRGAWLSWLLVQAPLTLSFLASGYLLVALAFGELDRVVGPALGVAALTLWQQRPRDGEPHEQGGGGRDDEPPTRRQDGAFLAVGAAAVLADTTLAVVVVLTGRLPLWAAWAGAGLLLVHGALLAAAALAVRRRFLDPPPGYDAPPPPKSSVEKTVTWRSTPEPLRSLLAVTALALAAFVCVLLLGFFLEEQQLDALFPVAFGVLGVSFLLLGGCIALDGRAAEAYAARLDDVRRSQGLRPRGGPTGAGALLARVAGVALAGTGALFLWVLALP